MKTIHKAIIDIQDYQELEFPALSILKWGVQNGNLVVWYLTDTDLPPSQRIKVKLCIIGTGNPIMLKKDEYLTHLESLQIGPFVWHLFELKNYKEEPDQ